eukprot:3724487-Rhodomonas_salina.1
MGSRGRGVEGDHPHAAPCGARFEGLEEEGMKGWGELRSTGVEGIRGWGFQMRVEGVEGFGGGLVGPGKGVSWALKRGIGAGSNTEGRPTRTKALARYPRHTVHARALSLLPSAQQSDMTALSGRDQTSYRGTDMRRAHFMPPGHDQRQTPDTLDPRSQTLERPETLDPRAVLSYSTLLYPSIRSILLLDVRKEGAEIRVSRMLNTRMAVPGAAYPGRERLGRAGGGR